MDESKEKKLRILEGKEKELKRIVTAHKKLLNTGYTDEEYRMLYYQLVNSLDFLIEN